MKKIILCFSLIFSLIGCGDAVNNDAGADGEAATAIEAPVAKQSAFDDNLESFKSCKAQSTKPSDCKTFLAKAICEYYGIADLKTTEGYLPYDEIPNYVKKSESWEKLGDFNENTIQLALSKIELKPAIVFNNNKSYVHVVAVKPGGTVSKSRKWGNVSVPACVSYFATNASKSFVNKGINYAFGSADGLEVWVKK